MPANEKLAQSPCIDAVTGTRARYPGLKARHRELREKFSTALALRTHRGLSWLQRAEQDVPS